MPPGTLRRIALFLGFCALVVVARVVGSATADLRDARALEARQEWTEAASRYGDAIRMYLPGLPVGAKASEALLGLAERARSAGDRDQERFVLEELRSAWLATRSTWQPGRRWVDAAEERLATLMLEDPRGNWPDRSLPAAERAAVVQETLAARDDPAVLWVLLMGVGYLTWLGGAALALWRGLPSRDDEPVRWGVLARHAAVSVAGYGLWLFALWKA